MGQLRKVNRCDMAAPDTAAKRLRMRSLRPFPVSSLCCSFSFGVLSNCPGTELAGMALKSSKTRKIHPRVFPFSKKKNLKLVISRCCFAGHRGKMHCARAVFLLLVNAPLLKTIGKNNKLGFRPRILKNLSSRHQT